jgi:FkbM family methyltransferase
LIRNKLKKLVINTLAIFNLILLKLNTYNKLVINEQKSQNILDLISVIKDESRSEFVKNIKLSKSQLAQDLFVLSELNFKKKGFFVEFGATNGINLSNTYLLEKKYKWNGILAEPARQWHNELLKNRDVFIEKNCVWTDSNKTLTFNEISELSTIDTFSNSDMHNSERIKGHKYEVKTISLEDLLDKYRAPSVIDYLSIDTEGSEFEILSAFNFEKYKFRVITCEHNFTSNRQKIFKFLTSKGYLRKYINISKFDDWYVLE